MPFRSPDLRSPACINHSIRIDHEVHSCGDGKWCVERFTAKIVDIRLTTIGRQLMQLLTKVRNAWNDARYFGASFALRRRLPFLAGRLPLCIGGSRFFVRKNGTDVEAARQVFIDREYDLERCPQWNLITKEYASILERGGTPIIIDAGANIGAASLWFSRLFPKAMIVAIEPDAENAELCRLNTRGINILVLEGALGSVGGTVVLSNPSHESWGIRTERPRDSSVGVPIFTIANVKEKCGPGAHLFIVKIDIEGFEADLFADNIEWIEEAAIVFIEPHDWMLPGQNTSWNFRRVLMSRAGELLIAGENLVFVNERLVRNSANDRPVTQSGDH